MLSAIIIAFVVCGLMAGYQWRMKREAYNNNLKRIQDEIDRLEASKKSDNLSEEWLNSLVSRASKSYTLNA